MNANEEQTEEIRRISAIIIKAINEARQDHSALIVMTALLHTTGMLIAMVGGDVEGAIPTIRGGHDAYLSIPMGDA